LRPVALAVEAAATGAGFTDALAAGPLIFRLSRNAPDSAPG